MSLVRNERLKLFATYLNGLAVATFAVGGLAPIFSVLYGTIPMATGWLVVLIGLCCLITSAALHWAGSLILTRLQS